MQNHIIKKQVLDITVPPQKNVYGLQNSLSTLYNTGIKEVLGEVLDSVFPEMGREHVRIDTLVLDLGVIKESNLESTITRLVRERFYDRLFQYKDLYEQPYDYTAKIIPGEISGLELLSFFLDNGKLPWWADKTSYSNLETLLSDLIQNSFPGLKKLLLEKVTDSRARKRIINQFSDSLLEEIAHVIFSFDKVFTRKLYEDIVYSAENKIPAGALRQAFWESILLFHVLEKNDLLSKKLTGKENLVLGFFAVLSQSFADKQIIKKFTRKLSKRNIIFSKLLKLSEIRNESFEHKISDILSAEPQTFEDEDLDPESYIENSGIILFHPFLAAYFSGLGLLKENDFKDKDAALRAVHLLQYLATGESETPEHLLTLNKVLCGLDILEPATAGIILEETEKTESQKLLEAVISHWKALKNTSPEALRNTFMKRNGIITKNNEGWLLKVERNSFDILLDKVPWAYTVIKLPWMKNILSVEW